MNEYVIDCCSLLNLFIGWGGLKELHELQGTWHICKAVLNEVEYAREYDSDGIPVMIPFNMNALVQIGSLLSVCPETEAEIDDYVNFAAEIGDGEAQSLAIAKHRGFVLLTDDNLAIKVASRSDVAVRTISTPEVLQNWAQLRVANEARLQVIMSRIEVLARFGPRLNSPHYNWWKRYRSC